MRHFLLVMGALLLISGCSPDKPTFDEAVYSQASPYFYITDEREDAYIYAICESTAQNMSREIQILGMQEVSGVSNLQVIDNYIELVQDYKCS